MKLRTFRDAANNKIRDEAHTLDFESAVSYRKKIYLGKLALYYRQGLFWYAIPYSYLDRVYKSVEFAPADNSPPYEYYRIYLSHDGVPFADIMFGESFEKNIRALKEANALLEAIHAAHPEIALGYPDEPSGSPEKAE